MPCGGLGALMGGSGAFFARLREVLGCPWVGLEEVLGSLGTVLGIFGAVLEPQGGHAHL